MQSTHQRHQGNQGTQGKDGKIGFCCDGVLSKAFYEDAFIDSCDLICVYRTQDGKRTCGYIDKDGNYTDDIYEAWFGTHEEYPEDNIAPE